MQFRDLKTQYQVLKTDIDKEIQNVLNECNFISGTQVKELEQQLAEFVGVKHCVTCANGTDALTMMMMAWNIKEDDAVFVPDFTFFASGEVVSFEGGTPVFYDVDKETFNADVESLEKAIEAVVKEGKLKPRAIIAVDLFGQPANYMEIEQIAKKYNLLVLEDGAQGFGGKIGDRAACSFGDAATTSFFPAKPLGCYGDGGAVFTNDDNVASYLRSIAVHGKGSMKYDNIRIGMNSRLDTIQAAVLKVKLRAFKEYELKNVNAVADLYTQLLNHVVSTPKVLEDFHSSWAQYTIRLKNKEQRDALQNYMKGQGVPTMVYYVKPMHQQLAFVNNKKYVDLSNAEELCDTVLSLPMHPYMQKEDITFVAEKVKNFLQMQ
ncbi:DegT/DnrJ/EryC1/StrS family aminotransferase [Faecalicatena contorta]|uniref:DegT/DnrJ/EryC1/StrS family aminotransferase n=1 Tax=Faecalicatena contorta TaxID=39482 RepID=UPI001F18A6DF|nr:DegT/DnrJ/EryC1/StrS family aminotransferase [Faecalicatena contorta]MCF2555885.1 DegT/DnrJ/EryC1/StrS family aminotransferase [Faecalicatena contorta]